MEWEIIGNGFYLIEGANSVVRTFDEAIALCGSIGDGTILFEPKDPTTVSEARIAGILTAGKRLWANIKRSATDDG